MRGTIGLAAIVLFAGPAVAEQMSGDVARGEYLVRGPMGCGNCHSPQGPEGPVPGMELGGAVVDDSEMAHAVAANITPGGEIADWSDAELAHAIREGLRPDGSLIGPPMPFPQYRYISDDDLAAIVAFLRTVPAVDNDPGKSEYHIPLPPAYGPPIDTVAAIPQGVTTEWGEYVVHISHCMECHSPLGPQGPMADTAMGQGGMEFHGPWGTSVAPNITSSADGLADVTDEQLKAMITQGLDDDGSRMLPPMPYHYFANMSPQDLDAVILYLRTVPPLPDAG